MEYDNNNKIKGCRLYKLTFPAHISVKYIKTEKKNICGTDTKWILQMWPIFFQERKNQEVYESIEGNEYQKPMLSPVQQPKLEQGHNPQQYLLAISLRKKMAEASQESQHQTVRDDVSIYYNFWSNQEIKTSQG